MEHRKRKQPWSWLCLSLHLLLGVVNGDNTHDTSRLRGSVASDRQLRQYELSRSLVALTSDQLNFFNQCNLSLLSSNVREDGIVSQNEFTENVVEFCSLYTVPSFPTYNIKCPDNHFPSLPAEWKKVFADEVCPTSDGMEGQEICLQGLENLHGLGVDFGYILTTETEPKVEMAVNFICLNLVPHIFPPQPPSTATANDTTIGSPSSNPSAPPSKLPPSVSRTEDTTNDLVGDNYADSLPASGSRIENITHENVLDLIAEDDSGDTLNSVKVPSASNSLEMGPIIGIVIGVVMFLLLLVIVAGRRRAAARSNQTDDAELRANQAHKEATHDLKPRPERFQKHESGSLGLFRKAPSNPISSKTQLSRAIDDANWDAVYKVASRFAENEDLSTLSSSGDSNNSTEEGEPKPRLNLSKEDQERAKTIDELVVDGDWTGVAVTAALYAGESGIARGRPSSKSSTLIDKKSSNRKASRPRKSPSSFYSLNNGTSTKTKKLSHQQAENDDLFVKNRRITSVEDDESVNLGLLKENMNKAVDSGDWDRVLSISSEVERSHTFQSMNEDEPKLPARKEERESGVASDAKLVAAHRTELERAVSFADWGMVGFYADRLKEVKSGGLDHETNLSLSTALVPASRPHSLHPASSNDTSDSDMARKQTLEKLIRAEKWKGVSIMAGLYQMEAKGALC